MASVIAKPALYCVPQMSTVIAKTALIVGIQSFGGKNC